VVYLVKAMDNYPLVDLTEYIGSEDDAGSPMVVAGPVGGGKRKRIIESDDESDDADQAMAQPLASSTGGDRPQPPVHVIIDEDEDWAEEGAGGARPGPPSVIGVGLVRKRAMDNNRSGRATPVDSLLSLPDASPPARSISSPDLFILEDTPERKAPAVSRPKDASNAGRQGRQDRNDKRGQPQQQKVKKSKHSSSSSSKKRDASGSSSGDSGDDGYSSSGGDSSGGSIDANEWDDDVTAIAQVKERVKNILATCGKLSDQLRKAMTKWGVSSSASTNCLNLTQISDTGNGTEEGDEALKVLRQSDFAEMCPDLVLKDYQTVGVNWMRLLHENRVNGVLADDMVCYMSICLY
jgi:hypothetical protein